MILSPPYRQQDALQYKHYKPEFTGSSQAVAHCLNVDFLRGLECIHTNKHGRTSVRTFTDT